MNELALFAGAGGGILGGYLLGWRTVCAVEIDEYARGVLGARQNDGTLPPFPIWDDIRTFDGRPWRGVVDVVSGGFPCQDISAAGKGAGITGSRSGLWSEMARIVGEVRPQFVLVENSPLLVQRGLAVVLGNLASLGYDARWGIVGAHQAGAPHKRNRIWILANSGCGRCSESEARKVQLPRGAEAIGSGYGANPNSLRELQSERSFCDERRQSCDGGAVLAHTDVCDAASAGPSSGAGQKMGRPQKDAEFKRPNCEVPDSCGQGLPEWQWGEGEREREATARGGWWATEPELGRVAHGVANRVDRLRAIGNGQVPAVVRLAWYVLSEKENL